MPRLRNAHGVVVNVSEAKAATLAGWTPVDDDKKAEPKRKASKSDK